MALANAEDIFQNVHTEHIYVNKFCIIVLEIIFLNLSEEGPGINLLKSSCYKEN